jgi:hypothetical protein
MLRIEYDCRAFQNHDRRYEICLVLTGGPRSCVPSSGPAVGFGVHMSGALVFVGTRQHDRLLSEANENTLGDHVKNDGRGMLGHVTILADKLAGDDRPFWGLLAPSKTYRHGNPVSEFPRWAHTSGMQLSIG